MRCAGVRSSHVWAGGGGGGERHPDGVCVCDGERAAAVLEQAAAPLTRISCLVSPFHLSKLLQARVNIPLVRHRPLMFSTIVFTVRSQAKIREPRDKDGEAGANNRRLRRAMCCLDAVKNGMRVVM